MSAWTELQKELRAGPRRWLVTGAAGFIGSHLVERLLGLGQEVTGLDNFATGRPSNLEAVRRAVGEEAWSRFRFLEGDIRRPEDCARAGEGAEFVLHQAALGSVPRSIRDPRSTHEANVDGFFHIAQAAHAAGARSFVYASSSSVYGDHPELPKREDRIGRPLSPYAASKRVDEVYAEALARTWSLPFTGLRYFNVFGPRQDPEGPYAAVIPAWLRALTEGEPVRIHGDGEQSRDFCPVANVVQANLLAACRREPAARVYNVALGGRCSLLELFAALQAELRRLGFTIQTAEPVFGKPRPGDVRHSQADIRRIREELGYAPEVDFLQGLRITVEAFAGPPCRARED